LCFLYSFRFSWISATGTATNFRGRVRKRQKMQGRVEADETFDDAMTAWWTDTLGLTLGDSSTKRDGGYRASIITSGPSTC